MEASVMGGPERSLGLSEAARRIEQLTGFRPSRSTLWRWHLSGRLPSRRVGRRLLTTDRDIHRMLAEDEGKNRGSTQARGNEAGARLRLLTTAGGRVP